MVKKTNSKIKKEEIRKEHVNKRPVGLIISTSVLGLAVVVFVVLFALSFTNLNNANLALENAYRKNFYDLVDNVNNSETELSKVLVTENTEYQKNLLEEVSKQTQNAQENLNNLPYSIHGLGESIKFINQLSGYTETLKNNIEKGQSLTTEQINTLDRAHDMLIEMKKSLNKISEKIWNGYSILDNSLDFDGDYNLLTTELSAIKAVDLEFPTMIYDGPFSDSQINVTIKGLDGSDISEDSAYKNLLNLFDIIDEKMVSYEGQTNGKFVTYNYAITKNGQDSFVQITKKGGKLLTYSANSDDDTSEKLSLEEAENKALNFVKETGIENCEVVWSDIASSNAYINIAPVQDNIILYPDLIKIKIDLSSGNIIGYEATSYYTNHVNRNLGGVNYSAKDGAQKVSQKFQIDKTNLVLIPKDYGKEILCHEYVCTRRGADYYVYLNAKTGAEENVLKVIQTDNGNLLY